MEMLPPAAIGRRGGGVGALRVDRQVVRHDGAAIGRVQSAGMVRRAVDGNVARAERRTLARRKQAVRAYGGGLEDRVAQLDRAAALGRDNRVDRVEVRGVRVRAVAGLVQDDVGEDQARAVLREDDVLIAGLGGQRVAVARAIVDGALAVHGQHTGQHIAVLISARRRAAIAGHFGRHLAIGHFRRHLAIGHFRRGFAVGHLGRSFAVRRRCGRRSVRRFGQAGEAGGQHRKRQQRCAPFPCSIHGSSIPFLELASILPRKDGRNMAKLRTTPRARAPFLRRITGAARAALHGPRRSRGAIRSFSESPCCG